VCNIEQPANGNICRIVGLLECRRRYLLALWQHVPDEEVDMPLSVVLAAGLDSWLLATHTKVWRSAGYFVVSADSIGEAIDLFNDGDFDLVVLGDSFSIENRESLTSLIRATGSQTPVAFIGNTSSDSDSFADSTLKNDLITFLAGLRKLLAEKAKMPVAPRILQGDVSHR
jgi:hypothetical protein